MVGGGIVFAYHGDFGVVGVVVVDDAERHGEEFGHGDVVDIDEGEGELARALNIGCGVVRMFVYILLHLYAYTFRHLHIPFL